MDLGSMNLDEFLDTISFSIENQSSIQRHDNTTMAPSQPSFCQANNNGETSQQPSLCSKTMDEVWKEIQRGEQHNMQEIDNNHTDLLNHHSRQVSSGKITVEDFLFGAGVDVSSTEIKESGIAPTLNPEGAVYYSQQQQQQLLQQQINSIAVALEVDQVQQVSSGESFDHEIEQHGRKRKLDGSTRVVTGKRYERMVKNRESAARSREKKKAYTTELEAEMCSLRAENARLKYELEIMQQEYNEDEEEGKQDSKAKGRKLRRSSSQASLSIKNVLL